MGPPDQAKAIGYAEIMMLIALRRGSKKELNTLVKKNIPFMLQ